MVQLFGSGQRLCGHCGRPRQFLHGEIKCSFVTMQLTTLLHSARRALGRCILRAPTFGALGFLGMAIRQNQPRERHFTVLERLGGLLEHWFGVEPCEKVLPAQMPLAHKVGIRVLGAPPFRSFGPRRRRSGIYSHANAELCKERGDRVFACAMHVGTER